MSTAASRIEAASIAGMALGLGAHTLFSVHDALIKAVVISAPATQILFLRSLVITALCLAFGRSVMVRDLVRSRNKPLILGRGLMTLAAWVMYYSAGRELQLAEMATLYYFSPVITTVLAVIFLKEQLTLARVGAASIGFFGVLVAANPSGFSIGWPVVMVLAAALCWALAMILMRTISRSESTVVQVFAQNLIHLIVMGAIALPLWQGMDATQISFCVGAALIGGLGQYLLVDAARQVPASVLGTVEYGALIWSFVLGYLFFGEAPASTVYVGALLVIAAGLTLAVSERRSRQEVVNAP